MDTAKALPLTTHMTEAKAHQPDPLRVTKCLPLASSSARPTSNENVPVKTVATPQNALPIMDKAPVDTEKIQNEVSWLFYFFLFSFFWCLFCNELRVPVVESKAPDTLDACMNRLENALQSARR